MTAPTAKDVLDNLHRFLDDAEARLVQGEDIDLTGIEEQVAVLCDEAQALPVGEGAVFAKEMEALFERFSQLQDKLKAEFSLVKEELSGLPLRSKAARAYAVNDALKPPKKEEK